MTYTQDRKIAEALAAFIAAHEYTVTNALQGYARDLRESAARLMNAYEQLMNGTAEDRAKQDQSLMPTEAMPVLAQSMEQSADTYERAAGAWDDLAQLTEDES